MKRRDFLKTMSIAAVGTAFAPDALARVVAGISPDSPAEPIEDRYIRDYLEKMKHFDEHHPEDVCLDKREFRLLSRSLQRLSRLQKTVGHGNFYLLNFDEALSIARNYLTVGQFSKDEIEFLEMIFYRDSLQYGFCGEKPFKNLTDRVRSREVIKIHKTGNYLYKGLPLQTYERIKKDLGDDVILTSGIRSVIKQFMLFLSKADESSGNLSMASRSLAPPGYSFHGVGDFDVGQVGYGADNFTERFTTTKVFQMLSERGYLNLRYENGNRKGVRFEPWHIKVGLQAC